MNSRVVSRIKLFGVSFLVVVFAFSQAKAQEETKEIKDLETWSGVGISYKLNDKWSFGLQQQLRMKTNSTVVDNYFTQLETGYKLCKNFKLGLGLRYVRSNDNKGKVQGYENHFRFNVDATYKHSISRLVFKHRIRYQNKNEIGVSSSDGDYAIGTSRLRSGLTYNIKKWKLDPEVSGEIFYRSQKGDANGFNKYRFVLGTSYKLKKIGEIGLNYAIERELNVSYPKTTSIIAIKFTYKI